uniref:Probable deoxycytidylate deaminase n=1 Tax=Caenorhabditis japonica TaxID=281687 RepID=A0A8R1E8Y4_CAEJA
MPESRAPSIEESLNCLSIEPDKSQRQENLKKEVTDLEKHQRFIRIAKVTSLRSKDPNTQVGCVIVDKDNCIVSIGYNGFPIGVDDDVFRWDKEDPEDNKHLYVVHAEMNAIINKRCATLHDCVVYVTLFPCNKCAQILIQSRVKKVYYLEDRDELAFRSSKRMLDHSKIPYEQIIMPKEKYVIRL